MKRDDHPRGLKAERTAGKKVAQLLVLFPSSTNSLLIPIVFSKIEQQNRAKSELGPRALVQASHRMLAHGIS